MPARAWYYRDQTDCCHRRADGGDAVRGSFSGGSVGKLQSHFQHAVDGVGRHHRARRRDGAAARFAVAGSGPNSLRGVRLVLGYLGAVQSCRRSGEQQSNPSDGGGAYGKREHGRVWWGGGLEPVRRRQPRRNRIGCHHRVWSAHGAGVGVAHTAVGTDSVRCERVERGYGDGLPCVRRRAGQKQRGGGDGVAACRLEDKHAVC